MIFGNGVPEIPGFSLKNVPTSDMTTGLLVHGNSTERKKHTTTTRPG
jgi:hypothetical protein